MGIISDVYNLSIQFTFFKNETKQVQDIKAIENKTCEYNIKSLNKF